MVVKSMSAADGEAMPEQAPLLPGQLCSKEGWPQAPGSEMGAGLYVGNRLHSQTGESRRRKEQREKD